MGLNLSANILTSGFLVSVVVFFVLMGYFFSMAYSKTQQVLERGDGRRNDLGKVDAALSNMRVAYILGFIAAGVSLLLAVLYAGHETIVSPSEYWHLALYFIAYALLVISVIYAFLALNKLYDLDIEDRNGADAYLWAGLFVALFGFMGLTATGSGRLGMNIARSQVAKRVGNVEGKVNEHLPAIRSHVENVRHSVETDLPAMHAKIDQLHSASFSRPDAVPVVRSAVASPQASIPLSRPSTFSLPRSVSTVRL